MIKEGKYTLAEQSGDAGFYAEVAVRVSVEIGDSNLAISYGEEIEEDWRISIAFGIVYGREHMPRELRAGKKISVKILSVQGHLVDTITIALAFASAKAFWNAMDHDGPMGFVLEKASRTFHIPK